MVRVAGAVAQGFQLALLLVLPCIASAQPTMDSARVYDGIERFAGRSKVTRWLYDAVFVDPPEVAPKARPSSPRATRDPNKKFAGRPIRSIDVRVMDPFGGGLEDSTVVVENRLERWGNALHMRTRQRVARGRLLFKEGDALDPLRLSESERLLRATPMVNDARIRARAAKGAKDSVDVVVLIQDRWSLDGGISGDQTSVSAELVERNLLGTGQEFSQSFAYTLDAPYPEWGGTHRVYAFGNTYVGSTARYGLRPEQDDIALSLDRPFFSPVARWAGNVTFAHAWLRQQVDVTDVDAPFIPAADRYTADAWFGWNMSAKAQGKASDGMRERVVALRIADNWYAQRIQGAAFDSLFTGDRSILASFGLGARRYAHDRYLYRFGQTEDVVEGLLWTTTAGVRWPQRTKGYPYIGSSLTRAAYMGNGDHLSVRVAIGGMMDRGTLRDGIVFMDLDVFSRSFNVGRWRVRQFLRTIAARSVGTSPTAVLSIAPEQLIGFSRDLWQGSSKLLVRTETVAYMPGSFIGFRFAPVLSLGFGMLSPPGARPWQGLMQPAVGLGVLVRNERLLIRSFQVSFAFYPAVLDEAGLWQWDALRSLGLRTADLAPGRPDLIAAP